MKVEDDESNGPHRPVKVVRVKSPERPTSIRVKQMVDVSPLQEVPLTRRSSNPLDSSRGEPERSKSNALEY